VTESFKRLDWDSILQELSRHITSDFVLEYGEFFSPCFDYKSVIESQKKVKFFWELIEKGASPEFKSLTALSKIFKKAFKRGLFLPVELKYLKDWFVQGRKFLKIFEGSELFKEFTEVLREVLEVESSLDGIFDYSREDVKDRASYTLYVIRRKIREAEDLLFSKLEKIREHFSKKGYLQEDLITQRNGRYVLPVKVEFKNKVRGILHEVSQSGATAFIEPVGIIGISNELEELKYKEQREVSRILREFSLELFDRVSQFMRLERLYAEVEASFAKAEFGRSYRGVFPRFSQEKGIKLIKGFHPLLFFESKAKGLPLVTNDFFVERGLLITGPNLGGKTVSLKTVGIAVLLAQLGCPVPAKEAELEVFKKVFVDLGDEQSIVEGESSFSSHLKNLKNILEEADEHSLVLLDEPGKGTNPEEGAALVGAIIEELVQRRAKLVVTTHSQFLKSLSLKLKGLKIATMEFDQQKKAPTYRLIYGVWGESFALELARNIGFPERVLNRAREYLKTKEYWEWYKLLEEERKRVKELKTQLEAKEKELKEGFKALEKERETLRKEYYENLEKKLSSWDKEFRKFLSELETQRFSFKPKRLVEKFDAFVDQVLKDIDKPREEELKEGDEVEVISLKTRGKVLKIKGDVAEVLIGNLKTEIPLKGLKKLESGEKKRKDLKSGVKVKAETELKDIRIKLLGLSVDEAIPEVEKAINRAFLSGIKKVYLVHGHGTGRLRDAIRSYLSSHPLVKRFEFAEDFEGGRGVTVAYLEEKN